MSHITKITAVKNTTAIWEYDPGLPTNHVLGGSLDVIAAIQTLAIKIQSSGQHIEFFHKLQVECGVTEPLKIPLHSNVQWGSALAWRGEKEQSEERAMGNRNAKNWQDEARKIVEQTMEHYWKTQPREEDTMTMTSSPPPDTHAQSFLSEYDHHRQSLLTLDHDDGWAAELHCYLKDIPANVTKETDIVEWNTNNSILPSRGSPSMFSPVKHHLYLVNGSSQQIMKFGWHNTIPNLAAWNVAEVEDISLGCYQDLLGKDSLDTEFDGDENEMVIDYP
ncbi:hypothetical protein EDB83DRAFT_2516969 [Lactarius deliciosus]|nr:hypothetical protein EDB83DRAFT_2516969 [Lactarius deliciosus]